MSRFTFARILAVLILSALLAFMAPTLFAAQVTLTWDAAVNAETVAGYKVYYGTASRQYSSFIDVKKVTTYTVTGLGDGTTYYFAVTAYSNAGQSGYSGEVVFSPPQSCTYSLSSRAASFPSSGGAGSVTVSTPAGCKWNSSSLPSWVTLASGATGTGNLTVVYSVAPNNSGSSRTADLTIAGQVFTVSEAGPSAYTITAAAGPGGLISPPGTVTVVAGRAQAFSMARYSGRTVANVKVDGVSLGPVPYYIFSNVNANHTISVTFK